MSAAEGVKPKPDVKPITPELDAERESMIADLPFGE